jgi:hypothetical protein
MIRTSLPKDIYTYIKNVCATEESVRAFINGGDIYDPVMYKSVLHYCILNRQWSLFILLVRTEWCLKEYVVDTRDYEMMPVNIKHEIISYRREQHICTFLFYCKLHNSRDNYPLLRILYNEGRIPMDYELRDNIRKYCSERLWGHVFWSIIMRLRIREFRERYYALHAPGYLLAKQKFEKKIHVMNLVKND